MKIAITGSHGTGKSTLARALAEKLQLPMISEVARSVIREHRYADSRDYIKYASNRDKVYIQSAIFQRQYTEERISWSFVSDRSVLDAVAYAEVVVEEEGVSFQTIKPRAMSHVFNYDLLVYVPIMFDLQPDGFREATNKQFQTDVDERVRQMVYACDHLGIPVHYIMSDKLEDRVREVVDRVAH